MEKQMITKLKHHDRCEVQIVFGRSRYHTAHLECCDPKCKHKHRWIQWLSHQTVDDLRTLGVPCVNTAQKWLEKRMEK